jgi:hypothetical protein
MTPDFSKIDYMRKELRLSALYGQETMAGLVENPDKLPELIERTIAKYQELDKRVTELAQKNEEAYRVISERMGVSARELIYLKEQLELIKQGKPYDYGMLESRVSILPGRCEAINRVLLENRISD